MIRLEGEKYRVTVEKNLSLKTIKNDFEIFHEKFEGVVCQSKLVHKEVSPNESCDVRIFF